jgi:hypothetical protein
VDTVERKSVSEAMLDSKLNELHSMDDPPRVSKTSFPLTGWSTRLLILALIGILFLTLFPFRFAFHARLPANRSPFFLGGWGKIAGASDDFLNVLLFIPFGFALSERFRESGRSWRVTLVWAFATGALLSYGIEFLQSYIPLRDSGWEDVVTNTAGSVAGFVLFDACGKPALQLLSAGEWVSSKLVEWPRAIVAIPVYFSLWFAVSVPLQMQTRLSNWASDSVLVVGNDASGRFSTAWKGQLFRLEIWNRAITAEAAENVAKGETLDGTKTGLLADYDFSKRPQLADRRNFLPELTWVSGPPTQGDPPYLVLDGRSWLISEQSVSGLVDSLQKTNQIAVRLLCKPEETAGSDGRIAGIWERSGSLEIRMRQEDANLIIFFRNPMSVKRSDLVWHIPNVFEPDRMRDILFSYDGSTASLYLEGKQAARPYRLGPGTALSRAFRMVRTTELDGYNYIYYFLVFFPGGILIGISARSIGRSDRAVVYFSALTFFLLPALLLEFVLVSVSGRPVSFEYLVLSVLLSAGGSLWIHAERSLRQEPDRRLPDASGNA